MRSVFVEHSSRPNLWVVVLLSQISLSRQRFDRRYTHFLPIYVFYYVGLLNYLESLLINPLFLAVQSLQLGFISFFSVVGCFVSLVCFLG